MSNEDKDSANFDENIERYKEIKRSLDILAEKHRLRDETDAKFREAIMGILDDDQLRAFYNAERTHRNKMNAINSEIEQQERAIKEDVREFGQTVYGYELIAICMTPPQWDNAKLLEYAIRVNPLVLKCMYDEDKIGENYVAIERRDDNEEQAIDKKV